MKFDIALDNANSLKEYYNENDKKIERLLDASNINILIGANNSGKSRFIREILPAQLRLEDIAGLEKRINEINSFIDELKIKFFFTDKFVIVPGVNIDLIRASDGIIEFKIVELKRNYDRQNNQNIIKFNLEVINFIKSYYVNYDRLKYYIKGPVIIEKKINQLENSFNLLLKMYDLYLNRNKIKNIFIPTLRTAHSLFQYKNEKFSKISTDIFKQTTIKSYQLDISKTEIFTGQDLYYQIVNVRNDIKEKREAFEKFEEFLSKHFFHGKKVEIVAKFNIYDKHNGKDDSEIINVYIDGESKDLHELGDGIQALFVLMYKIYTCDNESLIFIDEPEINLHPGMQRLFLEQITINEFLKEKKLIYFISTHSNHFLDLTIEKENISIFLFNKVDKDKFVVKNVNHGDNSALQYLGVTNSSVFLANCSIWVEGISDRNYLKAFLKAYCKSLGKTYPKEDIDFAFIEYAGSNIDHYNFDEDELKEKINAFSINNKIFLISDYDGEYRDKKHEIYETIARENDNFEYYTTKDYKEIENVLPFKVWDKILIYFCDKRKIKTDENRERVRKQISDSLSREKEETYKDAYIGKLLKNIKSNVPELNKIWDNEESTLMNKAEVSYKVLELTEKGKICWEDFKDNPKIVSVIKSLYDFIQKSNYK